MRVLYIGEIVGSAGVFCVKSLLPELKKERSIDFVIANADGATGGFGIGKNHSIYLHKMGIDVLTSGECIYYKKDMVGHIGKAPYLLRPANYPQGNPGRGWRICPLPGEELGKEFGEDAPEDAPKDAPKDGREEVREDVAADAAADAVEDAVEDAGDSVDAAQSGESDGGSGAAVARSGESDRDSTTAAGRNQTIGIINLLGQSGFHRIHLNNPFLFLPKLVERINQETRTVVVDFHAATTAEKYTMFYFMDGKVSAILGSHGKVLTADETILPGGTAVISGTGRTGSSSSIGGFEPEIEIRKLTTQVHEHSKIAWKNLELQGVILSIDAQGKADSIERIRLKCKGKHNDRAPENR